MPNVQCPMPNAQVGNWALAIGIWDLAIVPDLRPRTGSVKRGQRRTATGSVLCGRPARLAAVERVERLSLLAVRVVGDRALVVEHHRGAAARIERRPVGQQPL